MADQNSRDVYWKLKFLNLFSSVMRSKYFGTNATASSNSRKTFKARRCVSTIILVRRVSAAIWFEPTRHVPGPYWFFFSSQDRRCSSRAPRPPPSTWSPPWPSTEKLTNWKILRCVTCTPKVQRLTVTLPVKVYSGGNLAKLVKR